MLIKSPHWEPENEKEKKVKWKKQRKRSIMEFEELVYEMTQSSRDIKEVFNEWKKAGHEVIEACDEFDYLLYGCEEEILSIKDESGTETDPMFPKGLSSSDNVGGAEGNFQREEGEPHNCVVDVKILFGQSIMIVSLMYWKSDQLQSVQVLFLKFKNPGGFRRKKSYNARCHQKALPGGATSSYTNGDDFISQNPLHLDWRKILGGGKGSHNPKVTGSFCFDYPRRTTMHTT
jgi:hypothetical protein